MKIGNSRAGGGAITGDLGVKPPASGGTEGLPTNFYNFDIKNTHFGSLLYGKRACREYNHYGQRKNIAAFV